METIEWARVFVKVVQFNSFTRAAEHLNIPKSNASKIISKLEAETGTKLIVRTTRSQTLTAAGRLFYENCLGPIQQIEDAQKSLYGSDNIIAGTIRITAPEDIGNVVIAPLICELSRQYHNLKFELNYTNQILDLIRDNYDLAIRIGQLQSSGLFLKKVGTIKFVVVASKAYLQSIPTIRQPEDLIKADILGFESMGSEWTLHSEKGRRKVRLNPKIISNHPTSILRMAEAGGGIALLPKFIVDEHLKEGRLVQLLNNWSSIGHPVSILSPLSIANTPRIKVVADKIASKLQAKLE